MPDRRRTLAALQEVLVASEQYREALTRHAGLGRTEAQAIGQLAQGPLGQTDLATRLNLSTGAVTALVDRLEAAGLARRSAHLTDRRRSVVSLTERGSDIVQLRQDSINRLFEGLDRHDLIQATAVLHTLAQNIRREVDNLE